MCPRVLLVVYLEPVALARVGSDVAPPFLDQGGVDLTRSEHWLGRRHDASKRVTIHDALWSEKRGEGGNGWVG